VDGREISSSHPFLKNTLAFTCARLALMIAREEKRWCVAERRPTGPDKIFYLGTFRSRAEAEAERERLAALPEKAGFHLSVTIFPDLTPKPRRLRNDFRRIRR